MKHFFPDVFGNQKAKNAIGKSIIDNSLSHAYIIEGPHGSGKTMLAHRIAAALTCENKKSQDGPLPCMRCDSCKKILSNNSPDVYILERENGKATIGVDLVREMRSDMFLSANESEYKVYIIEEAHLMNDAAQNALLKVLEEPPQNVITLLLCETTDNILPTVKSRAQIIRASLFDVNSMSEFLLNNNNTALSFYNQSKENFLIALEASGGSIGRALELMSQKEFSDISKKRQIIDGIISAFSEKADFVSLHNSFSPLSKKRNELIDELSLLFTAIRDLILLKRSRDVSLAYYYDRDTATDISEKLGIGKLYAISDAIFSALCDLNQNANVGLTINALLSEVKK